MRDTAVVPAGLDGHLDLPLVTGRKPVSPPVLDIAVGGEELPQ